VFGAALGALAATFSEECSHNGGGSCVGPGLLLGAIGSGVGIGIDALIKGRKVIYLAPAGHPDAQVSIVPVITEKSRGCALIVRF
jgi:hypothetical protein